MNQLRIPLDQPRRRSRVARRRSAYRWASVVLIALISALCLIALPAIAAAIHFGA